MKRRLLTIGWTPTCEAQAGRLLSEGQEKELEDHLSENPTAGVVIPGTGGIRKLRWALEGRGKRGGARVIYFFHADWMPLYLLGIYAKNEKEDLEPKEKKEWKRLTEILVSQWHEKRSKP